MDRATISAATLRGWRARVGNSAADAVATRTPVRQDTARAVVGSLFVLLSAVYVLGSVLRMVRRVRR
jgi:cytochrome b561